MAEIGTLVGKPKDSKTFEPDPRWVLPRTRLGLEFEYEGVADPGQFYFENQLTHYWEVRRDDSLKDAGAEFVFRAPMFGVDAWTAIHTLMIAAEKAKLKCSIRAGIHVHLDVRDMETSQLVGLIILYTILEPILFKWIGDSREFSIFCIPFYRADESLLETCQIVNAILRDEKDPSTKMTISKAKKFARYAALNLNALAKYGSVEFRHMRTTHDIQRVIDWINIIQSLKAATLKLPTSDGAIVHLARTTRPNAFLEYVFGEELARKLWSQDAEMLINTVGIPTARDLVLYGLTNSPWEDELHVPLGKHAGFHKFLAGLLAKKKPTAPADLIEQLVNAAPAPLPNLGRMVFTHEYRDDEMGDPARGISRWIHGAQVYLGAEARAMARYMHRWAQPINAPVAHLARLMMEAPPRVRAVYADDQWADNPAPPPPFPPIVEDEEPPEELEGEAWIPPDDPEPAPPENPEEVNIRLGRQPQFIRRPVR